MVLVILLFPGLFKICHYVRYWKTYQQVVALFNKYISDHKMSNCE